MAADRFRLLQRCHFAQTAQVTLGLTELGTQKRLDKIPGYQRSNGTAPHANNVHVVVLNPLPGREVVVHQAGTNTRYLVCAHRRTDAATADCHPALDRSGHHSSSERDNEVGIVVVRVEAMRPEIDELMPRSAETSNQFFLQTKPTMIRSYSHTHVILLACTQQPAVLPPRGLRVSEPVRGAPARLESIRRRPASDGAFPPSHSQSQPKGSGGHD